MRGAPGPRPQLLVALFGAALLLLNFPLLVVWDRPVTVLGLPLLPVALFAIWAGLIAALAFASEHRPPTDRREDHAGEPRADRDRGGAGGGAG